MPRRPVPNSNQKRPHTEKIEGAWLLKALAAVFAIAAACVYLMLCFFFHRGQWQAVLHPVRVASTESAATNLIRFAPDDSAQPQLTGEWLHAAAGARYAGFTVLFLPGGDGMRSNFVSTQAALQNLGLNVFVFDYRGYGRSANVHPSEERMTADSEAAWSYLTKARGISGSTILPYGVGVGASLAAHLAREHAEIPGLILDTPYTDLREVVRQNPRFRLLPVGILFHEDFPLAGPISNLAKPKLLIATGRGAEPVAYRTAADPKLMVSFAASSGPVFDEAVTRFLDQYVVSSPAPSGTKRR